MRAARLFGRAASRTLLLALSLVALAGCGSSDMPPPSAMVPVAPTPLTPTPVTPPVVAAPKVLRLSGEVGVPGDTLYLPFDMPEGIERMEAVFDAGSPATKLGLGVFDERGTAFQHSGFRGISGEERREFFIDSDEATLGFTAGPLKPGRWTIVVPNFLNFTGTAVVRVTLFAGTVKTPPPDIAAPAVVKSAAGWYRGDLHVHTSFSSDAFGSGASLMPAAMALRAQSKGLDFIALTDHNVSRQNARLPVAAPPGFLLLGGEEVTTWVGGPGHLVVAGLDAGEHIDWRFRPVSGRYMRTPTWKPDDKPIQDVLAYTRANDIFTTAAHPYVAPGLGSDWGFFPDSDQDIDALPDALEVWNDEFTMTSGDLALKQWDTELARNRKLCGNGGSDLHGIDRGIEVGEPTTVVFANALSRDAVVAALRNCRSYITTNATTGPALLLSAATAGGEPQMMGGTVTGTATDLVVVSARATGGSGAVLTLISNGVTVLTTTLTGNDQTVSQMVPLGAGGGVRAELRASVGALAPLALSNPVFLRNGSEPAAADPRLAQAQALLPGR